MLHTKVKPHSWCDYVTRITMLYQSVDLSAWVCRVSNVHILSCYLSQIHPHNLYTNLLTRIELLNIGYILTIYAELAVTEITQVILEYVGQWSSQTQAIVTEHHQLVGISMLKNTTISPYISLEINGTICEHVYV